MPLFICYIFLGYRNFAQNKRYFLQIWQTKAFLWSFLVSSTYNLVTITIERYLAVVHPIWHKLSFNRNTQIFTLICPYIVGVGFTMGLVTGSSAVQNGKCLAYSYSKSNTVRRVAGIIIRRLKPYRRCNKNAFLTESTFLCRNLLVKRKNGGRQVCKISIKISNISAVIIR